MGVRVCHVAGFDVRGFNVFRSTTGAVYDLEEAPMLLLLWLWGLLLLWRELLRWFQLGDHLPYMAGGAQRARRPHNIVRAGADPRHRARPGEIAISLRDHDRDHDRDRARSRAGVVGGGRGRHADGARGGE